ncbi:MAG: DUF2069 domain-containing protein [Gammaproteobacteria bacterium]|nr:DUF2069 domain-containing protein [Gammaproteobacteria bacterium]MDH5594696.1 DUF2069 domain-containing protein [Gammaproteobacteria bacterium]
MSPVKLSWTITLTGYFGLLVLIALWYTVLAPSVHVPVFVMLIVFATPLLFPLRGLLHGRRYTFQWSSYLALFYLIHGIVEAYSTPAERMLAGLEILFSLLLYTGCILYARLAHQ